MPLIPTPCDCCSGGGTTPLTCATDSVTICPGDDPITVVSGPLTCDTDSVTTCPQAEATAASLGAATAPEGTAVVTRPGDWAINDAPAAAIAASATKAAGAAGERHVATALSFIICAESATAPTATNLNVTLRDGASGVGTILMIWRIHVAADMLSENIAQVTLGGLNVVGSVNTAMTLEFNAGVINILEAVNLTGYTAA